MKSNFIFLWGVMTLFPAVRHGSVTRYPDGVVQPRWATVLAPDDTVGASFYGDFFGGPLDGWLGDTASFEAVDGRLRLVEQARPPASISIPSTYLRNTVWEVGVEVAGTLSASNYIRLYVAASTPSLNEPQWGYHLQIDGVGASHVYRLWRQNGHTRTAIFESNAMPNRTDAFRARVRVTCTHDGQWQLFADEYDSGSFAVVAGKSGDASVKDETYRSAGYSGYFVSFSPARWRDFKLDYLLIKTLDTTAASILPDMLEPGDLLINEILSNPKAGGVDFVEIYNYSNKTVDLSRVGIARVNANGTVGIPRPVSSAPSFIYPNEYKVLTSRPGTVKQHYPNAETAAFIEMPTLPNFNNETGGVVVYSQQEVIDSLFYTTEMQSPFMTNHRGVSLERQHFSVPTNAPGSFRSAAVAVGGATPGYQNSQYVADQVEDHVSLTSKTFSPDNDGFEDRLEINYRLPEGGFMANIDIFTAAGRLVKRLQRSQSLATEGTIYWDGLSDANERLPIGMYIAVIELYNAYGIRKAYRKSFVLAARL